ncbi:hypothetical protein [Paenibacillus aceti]|uniref:Prophage protein n=1 Tax=Paenibacillus aceti TaxID=1820010 RepID=A0ABQ1W800_9BACL|nr:hypothetical protein [Paenibacillus aceti]GGG15810.1 hypothetical protein GCM10010913_42250 [Paenibacillus aceti]
MIQRNLIECTIDISQPLPELAAVISAVLATRPDVDARIELLHALEDQITTALLALEGGEEDDE